MAAAAPGLRSGVHRLRGDDDLTSDLATPPYGRRALRRAAVLVPVLAREPGLTVLLTRRTVHLREHAGQISFPGGGMEPDDPSPEATALREATEEVGLEPDLCSLLGRLDDYVTRTGFRVTPVVALVTPPVALAPDPFEVAEVFEVPLGFLIDPANHEQCEAAGPDGLVRRFWTMPYRDWTIWGATAGMIRNLHEILHEGEARP